jgi:nucleoside-diphosphate-sugar epimerase
MIVIFGGSGFLGRLLIERIRERGGLTLPDSTQLAHPPIVIADMSPPNFSDWSSSSLRFLEIDITDQDQVRRAVGPETAAVFHLAAVVSGTAEANFDLGMRVNLFGCINVLEACRAQSRFLPCVATSSLAVFGPNAPAVVGRDTALHPRSSYGVQKAILELLCADYRRKRFVDARVLRLPTITVRPGVPNGAASSFVSGIIREPAKGDPANCPVDPDLPLWISSPHVSVANLLHAVSVPDADWPQNAVIDSPGISVTSRELVHQLRLATSDEVAERVHWKPDPAIEAIVATWPSAIDTEQAMLLGFKVDADARSILDMYLRSG